MHDALITGLPIMVIIIGILVNRHDVRAVRDELRADMKDLRAEVNRRFEEVNRRFEEVNRRFEGVNRRFDLVDAELRCFHGHFGQLQGRVDELSKGH